MRKRMHTYLHTGLDFNDAVFPAEDYVEELPKDEQDPAAQAAKRRRVELIAANYLTHGRFPQHSSGHQTKPLVRKHMHNSLKSALDFDDAQFNAEDYVEELPKDESDPEARAAKRQRIETIATNYLTKGQIPTLLSAGLRGPFNGRWADSWRAKWVGKAAEETAHLHRDESPCTVKAVESNGITVSPPQETVRPEGGELGYDAAEERPTKSHKHSVSREADSKASEFIHDGARRRSPLRVNRNVEEWLKRRMDDFPESHVEVSGQDSAEASSSPSRWTTTAYRHANIHSRHSSIHSRPEIRSREASGYREVHNASPNARILARRSARHPETHAQEKQRRSSTSRSSRYGTGSREASDNRDILSPNIRTARPLPNVPESYEYENRWKSSASASMLISSQPLHFPLDKSAGRVDVASTPFLGKHLGPARAINSSPLLVQSETPMIGPASSIVHTATRGPPVSEELVMHHAATVVKSSAQKPPKRRKRKARENDADEAHNHYPVLPSPASSGSFKYRKIGNRKNGKAVKAIQEAEPLVLPNDEAIRRFPVGGDPQKNSGASPQRDSQQKNKRDSPRDSIGGVDRDSTRGGGGNHRESIGSSRLSLYSTQAAMMLAQREFQEGTFPSLSETPHGKMQSPAGGTSDANANVARGPSPGMTPFHDSNEKLHRTHPDSGARVAPISTQDLFRAASPFAFSTVKKTAKAPANRSGLRFTVLTNHEEGFEHPSDIAGNGNSPTPSGDRVPLKVRNSRASFMTASAKGSQEPQRSQQPQPPCSKPSKTGLSSPLGFSPPLDGDLSFTDEYLRNLDGFT